MTHLKFGYPLIGAVAAVAMLAGCADESPWGNTSNEKGSISISLTTDSGIATAKPVFRSGEEETATPDPNDLSTYITVPKAEDFSISLEKADGKYSKTWTSLADFKTEAANSKFDTGSYTLTAYYGEKGKQDFGAPYFEATSTFTVLSDQTSEVSLEAELKNSMVKVNYTDKFKDYMSNYYSTIYTEGRTEDITYEMDETRAAFIEPNNANVTVTFTTKEKEQRASVSLGEFPPVAKTLHNITFDIDEGEKGVPALTVSFDDSVTAEDVSIDLTEELYTTPAPVITWENGIENGATIDMLEGTSSDMTLKMKVEAQGIIESATLTVQSAKYSPLWGDAIDLCQATSEQIRQLQSAGIEATGFGWTGQPTDKLAFLNLTNFGKNLPKGEHTISLLIKDQTGKTSIPAKVTLNSEEITITQAGELTPIEYGSGTATLTLGYNGKNPDDLKFKSNGQEVTVSSYEEDTSTRASETKCYTFTLTNVPDTKKSNVTISVAYGTKTPLDFIYTVNVPTYSITEYDAFSKYAYLRVEADDPSKLGLILDNLVIKGNGSDLTIASSDATTGVVTLTGLTSGTDYTVTSTITGDADNSNGSFKTESALAIPNGDFSSIENNKLESGTLQVGGEWHVTLLYNKQHKSSFSYSIPTQWANINSLTAWSQAKNRNTWYVVPSSWVEDGMGVMRNVGYNHDGPALENTGKAAGTTYYCTDHPEDGELNKAAGELFLGSYTYNGNESRSEGISFASRPQSITFDYTYSLENVTSDQGYALIEILDSEGNSLGKEVFALDAGSGSKTVNFSYGTFGRKAAKLKVSFKSSNKNTPPIYIPSNSELNEGTGNSSSTLTANTYHAVATGSVLKIDNVVAHYGDTPTTAAAAPKRKTTKRK